MMPPQSGTGHPNPVPSVPSGPIHGSQSPSLETVPHRVQAIRTSRIELRWGGSLSIFGAVLEPLQRYSVDSGGLNGGPISALEPLFDGQTACGYGSTGQR